MSAEIHFIFGAVFNKIGRDSIWFSKNETIALTNDYPWRCYVIHKMKPINKKNGLLLF